MLTKPSIVDVHLKNKVIKKVNVDKNINNKYFIKNMVNKSVASY